MSNINNNRSNIRKLEEIEEHPNKRVKLGSSDEINFLKCIKSAMRSPVYFREVTLVERAWYEEGNIFQMLSAETIERILFFMIPSPQDKIAQCSDWDMLEKMNQVYDWGFDLNGEKELIEAWREVIMGETDLTVEVGRKYFDLQYLGYEARETLSSEETFKIFKIVYGQYSKIPTDCAEHQIPNFVNEDFIEAYDQIEEDLSKTEIDLDYSNLFMLPSNILKVKNLQKLTIESDADCFQIPFTLKDMKNFKILSVSASVDYLPNLGEITELYVNVTDDDVYWETLGCEVINAKNLKSLSFIMARLTSVPSRIKNLIQLENLELCQNELVELPKEIGELTSLRVLNLSANSFKTLPKEIIGCQKLEEILLCDNEGALDLPDELDQLKNLKKIDLWGARLKRAPLFLETLPQTVVITGFDFSQNVDMDSVQKVLENQQLSKERRKLIEEALKRLKSNDNDGRDGLSQ